MNLKNLGVTVIVLGVIALGLLSFKNNSEAKKFTIFRQYLSADADFGNFILISYPDGKTKKQQLLQNKHANYELNDKVFVQLVNDLQNSGLEMKDVTSSGDAHLTITTIFFQ